MVRLVKKKKIFLTKHVFEKASNASTTAVSSFREVNVSMSHRQVYS